MPFLHPSGGCLRIFCWGRASSNPAGTGQQSARPFALSRSYDASFLMYIFNLYIRNIIPTGAKLPRRRSWAVRTGAVCVFL